MYFGVVLVASATWPGYSHVTQYVSELGSAEAPYPWLFNSVIVLAGVAAVAGAAGMLRFFRREGRPVAGSLAALALAAWGVGMMFGGWFPMPDPRHNGYGLIMGIVLLPPSLMVALRGRASRPEYLFLAAWLVATLVLLAILFGVGALVTASNVGLWQRALAVAMIPGIGIACGMLAARMRPGRAADRRTDEHTRAAVDRAQEIAP